MARDGKITDRPVETRQSKAVEDQIGRAHV